MRIRLAIAILALAAIAAVTFGTLGASARPDEPRRRPSRSGAGTSGSRGRRTRQSFDKTNVFQNESIWLMQQINESLYTVEPDGKTLKPWLATSYKVSKNGKKYTFKLRKGVRFSNGKAMTAADVKFSFDDARAQDQGWGYLDVGIKNIQAPNPSTVVFNLKYPWGPFLSSHRLLRKRDHPQELRRPEAGRVLQAPDRHWPVHVGQAGGRPVGELQAKSVLLAERQAVPRPGDLDVRLRSEHPRAAAARRADRDQRVPALQLDQEAPEHAAA